MSRDINPFGLRMPPELRYALEEASRTSGRSLNAEIVWRLEGSFDAGSETRMLETRIRDLEELTLKKRHLASEITVMDDHGDSAGKAKIAERNAPLIERIDIQIRRVAQEIDTLMHEIAGRVQLAGPKLVARQKSKK